ncbi:hypothetical protein A2781_02380 [Candidatus Gottesmanbacteria bacterium RIFCSPHIGHO2_01_FULL_42_27]|nr:MAG: Integrase catalytic region [Candidatus Gottesmanbacteria bacterium GW2011_GWC2_42_8]OGG12050.1 MAG: hypothetical protein A2781_02380 [Candidatus Gottesmanbacteria bacterium RIFCSPHIGHO2_01_FULL_42_27]OGG35357.1 MAG: hypothetical protein A2968_04580 [Candidatus Gottesmanbacteria bacterium RIFCSPLOWO2_01_FULL_42_22]
MKAHNILPGVRQLSRLVNISSDAKRRLKWFDWYNFHGRNASLTCRHFAISPDTFYRWKRRYKRGALKTLEAESTRPKTFRKSKIPFETIKRIVDLRQKDMAFSKYKIKAILKRDFGICLSASSIGRILTSHGLIEKSTLVKGIKRRKRINWKIPRNRITFEHRYKSPGHLVQIDTKHVIVLSHTYYQLTAIDCYTRITYSKVYTTSTTDNSRDFLINLLLALPFKVEAIQTDNGHEFLFKFHAECINRGITHFFSRPRTPTDNSLVERMIESSVYELWLFDESLVPEIGYLNSRITAWSSRFNTYRPNQSLNYLTPMEYYQLKKKGEIYGRL